MLTWWLKLEIFFCDQLELIQVRVASRLDPDSGEWGAT